MSFSKASDNVCMYVCVHDIQEITLGVLMVAVKVNLVHWVNWSIK